MYKIILVIFLLITITLIIIIMIQYTYISNSSLTVNSNNLFNNINSSAIINYITLCLVVLFFIFSLILGNLNNNYKNKNFSKINKINLT